jgi:DNA mismatch endonuclease (patch repair protein)
MVPGGCQESSPRNRRSLGNPDAYLRPPAHELRRIRQVSERIYDVPPTARRSRNMAANRRRDTRPELAVRSLLHAGGLRYRVDFPVVLNGVRIRPDIAFIGRRVAVFIDGCFWHCCPEHRSEPATNRSYWVPKLEANRNRDALHNELLRGAGWRVVRYWEHEEAAEVVAQITRVVRA